MDETSIAGMIAELARHRAELAKAKQLRAEMLKALEDGPVYQGLGGIVHFATSRINSLEADLHTLALEEYARTSSKKPHPALGIRVNTKVIYGFVEALDWCRANLPAVLTLDTKLFEAYAKTAADKAPVPCVTIEQVPQVTIKQDLSEYMIAMEPADDH